MKQSDIGVIGLAVMGENLVMNMESHGFIVSVFNRTAEKTKRFAEGRAKGLHITPAYSLLELVSQLKTPRIIMMMVKAGKAVDDYIESLLSLLSEGDIIIDGGNSLFSDTERRCRYVESKGLFYVGCGVSGGELGALRGPSLMPGGSWAAWEHVRPILQSIAAKVEDGTPCCQWVGDGGAGHFVKMVHNGIEYGDMELICEAYHLMKKGLGLSEHEMHGIFGTWNEGELNSYLIEITRDILAYRDTDGSLLVTKILDKAGQKGTGKWTVIAALEEGIPLTLISEAVFARCLSAKKEERVYASKHLPSLAQSFAGDKETFIVSIRDALYASKIISYTQGYLLMRSASKQYGWDLAYGDIALMWRGGCIIRSVFLEKIKQAFDKNPELENLLLDDYFKEIIQRTLPGWRQVCAQALLTGIPMPAFTSALSYYDGCRCEILPANLLQAQRDYFGAHTFERTDRQRGAYYHADWTGEGSSTAAGVYQV